jgi:hypothetical protein
MINGESLILILTTALLNMLIVVAVGYEITSVTRDDFNATQTFWWWAVVRFYMPEHSTHLREQATAPPFEQTHM